MPLNDIPVMDIRQHVVENLNTVVLWFDAHLALRYLNPAGEMFFSVSARRLAGVPATSLFLGNDGVVERFRSALESGHTYTEREVTLTLPGPRQTTVDIAMTPVSDPAAGLGLLVELTPLDRQLRISREENLLAQQSVSRALTRNLAHEIKNPLGGLRGAAQLLERELADPALKEYTSVIIGEADRLQNLVDRMLGPNSIPKKREINLHQVVERVRQLVAAEMPSRVRLIRDYDPSIPPLIGDPDQLIQAVLNIVRNAMQAVGKEGDITLRTRTLRQFTIGPVRHKLVIKLEVIDTGPGIPADIMEQIFYPMVSGRPGGTGLGLSIAQTIVSQHGGLIECTSEPGNTCFSLLLPPQP
jgi:two-component system nitrogen regulation sensor histidine kinase GlnL